MKKGKGEFSQEEFENTPFILPFLGEILIYGTASI